MKPCDIIFVHHRETHLLSKAIEFLTDGDFSHVALAVGENKIMDITPKGIEYTDMNKYLGSCHTVKIGRFPLTNEQIFTIREMAWFYIGRGYDWKQMWWNAIWTIAKKMRLLKLSRKLYTKNKAYEGFTCAEFIARCYLSAGILLTDSFSNCSPQEIYNSPLLKKMDYKEA
ncbi:MAG: hypothetical protein A3F67_05165 [Verrucomicrobia bacterium RIFCSPHIGHO2_12_FULL_41_10]|nr:MAG: hypothetical protein A3F67_05165 [Verrucomicrobia bacterium RIFCSPHIGHO2_12_FULL_41_10]